MDNDFWWILGIAVAAQAVVMVGLLPVLFMNS